MPMLRMLGRRLNWYVLENRAPGDPANVTFWIRVRRWHPGYWWALLSALWPIRITVRITIGDRR
jgi:hypothetical protein